MHITWLGWLLIPFGVYALSTRPIFLVYGMLLFCGFSGSAVINSPTLQFGLQPTQLLTIFLGIHFFFTWQRRTHSQASNGSIKLLLGPILCLLTFLILDVIVLAYGEGGTAVITQLIHFCFGTMTLVLTALYTSRHRAPEKLVKALFIGSILVSVWGIIQLILYYLNIAYPAFIFNNTLSKNALGYAGIMVESNFPRISSVATEPSTLTKYLVPVLGAMLILLREKNGKPILPRWQPILILFTIFISTSSGGYLGILLLSSYYVLFETNPRRNFLRMIYPISIITIFLIVFAKVAPSIAHESLYNKMNSSSFMERYGAIVDNFQTFLTHPLLGVGWGNAIGFDLFTKLLASNGLFGFFSFISALSIAIFNAHKIIIRSNSNISFRRYTRLLHAINILFIFQIIQSAIVGFYPSYVDFWIILGLLIGLTLHINTLYSTLTNLARDI